jgi:hypothetical protein
VDGEGFPQLAEVEEVSLSVRKLKLIGRIFRWIFRWRIPWWKRWWRRKFLEWAP